MSAVAPEGPTPDLAKDKAQSSGKAAEAGGSSDAPVKKLSAAAELKAKKQAEKAARRAQAIAAKTAAAGAAPGPIAATESPATQPLPQGGAADGKGAKSKARQDGASAAGAASQAGRGGKQAAGGAKGSGAPQHDKEKKEAKPLVPACFAHIPVAKRISLPEADRDVHPVVLALGQQMATFTLRENMARLKGTLQAFKEVLRSYEAPAGNAFSRHFVPHVLNPQIEYLTECRPMCFAMGNAIRLIKARVSDLDIETSDKQAIQALCRTIDAFIEEKIHYAEVIVTRNAAAMISDGDVVLTYGHHRLVQKAVQLARDDGKRFSVVVVEDSACSSSGGSLASVRGGGGGAGRDLAKLLRAEGGFERVSYVPRLVELGSVLRPDTKVVLGVESVFANGSLYALAGTSDVAAAASSLGLPVIALCESINVDRDRVAVEPLTYNEIDPEWCLDGGFRLLFDVTREKHVSVLVTEYETETGNAPPAAVLAILKKQDDPN